MSCPLRKASSFKTAAAMGIPRRRMVFLCQWKALSPVFVCLPWATPCDFDVTEFIRPGEENLLAVRCYAEGSMGGVWRPVVTYVPGE